jgi:E3 ubiquitin-protein ligase HUWE1
VEIIMDEGGDDDDDSEHSTDLSGESDAMDDEEEGVHDEDDEGSDGNSIIDMLEEQHMEDEVDGADGWTTDTDSVEEEEEMDEDEEVNEDEFGGFPPPTFPIIDPDEHGMNYDDEDLDNDADIEEFREMMGNLQGQIFDQMPEDEDEEDDDEEEPNRRHHPNWLSIGRTHTLRHGGRVLTENKLTLGGLQFRGGLFSDDHRRNITQRSCIP